MPRPARSLSVAAVLMLGVGAALVPTAAHAIDITVSTESEFRDALVDAVDGDRILLTGSGFTLTDDPLPEITTDIDIIGPGSAAFTIDASAGTAGLTFSSDVTRVGLAGFTLTGGENVPSGTDNAGVRLPQTAELIDIASDGYRWEAYGNDASVFMSDLTLSGVSDGLALLDLQPGGDSTVSVTNVSVDCEGNASGVWAFLSGASQATLSDITVTDCSEATGANAYLFEVFSDSALTATNLTASTTTSQGIFVNTYDNGTAFLSGLTVSDTFGGDGVTGAASGDSSLTVSNATITDSDDDGVDLRGSDFGFVTVSETTITGSGDSGIETEALDSSALTYSAIEVTASGGDGVTMEEDGGTATFSEMTSRANGSDGVSVLLSGAGGSVTFLDSTIDDNDSTGFRVRDFDDQSAGSLLRIVSSTVSNNASTGIDAALLDGFVLELVNSTVTANGGDDFTSVGIDAVDEDNGDSIVRVLHSTIVGNFGDESFGSPVVRNSDGQLVIEHSVIADNGTGDDIRLNEETGSISIDYSLIGQTDGPTQNRIDSGDGNLATGTDPLLGALADNGGPTLTMLPLTGSPLISAGNPAITDAPDTDQRGVDRVQGDAIEIGSVEIAVAPPVIPEDEDEGTGGDTGAGAEGAELPPTGVSMTGMLGAGLAALLAFGTGAFLVTRRRASA